jgi:hypothetical protein
MYKTIWSIVYLGFEVFTEVVMKSSIFWDITSCSPLKVNGSFGGTCRLHLQGRKVSWERNQRESLSPAFTLVSCSAYSSALKMEAICSSETTGDFKRTTWRYIQKTELFNYLFIYGSFNGAYWTMNCNRWKRSWTIWDTILAFVWTDRGEPR